MLWLATREPQHCECKEYGFHLTIDAERESSATRRSLVRWSGWFAAFKLSAMLAPPNIEAIQKLCIRRAIVAGMEIRPSDAFNALKDNRHVARVLFVGEINKEWYDRLQSAFVLQLEFQKDNSDLCAVRGIKPANESLKRSTLQLIAEGFPVQSRLPVR